MAVRAQSQAEAQALLQQQAAQHQFAAQQLLAQQQMMAQQLAAQQEALRIKDEENKKLEFEAAVSREAARLRALEQPQERKREPPQEVREDSHPHPLKLLATIYKGQYVCDKCSVRGSGQVYHCDICKFDMHPSCVQAYMAWQGLQPVTTTPSTTYQDSRHTHPLLKLLSVYQGSYACAGCKRTLKGEVYHCDLCKWDVCMQCFKA